MNRPAATILAAPSAQRTDSSEPPTKPTVNLRRLSPHQLGRLGERLAAAHLQRDRMQILARNWRHRLGELDLIARSADTVVFCEVKTRRSGRYGGPLGAVDGEKLHRIERLARRLAAAALPHRPALAGRPARPHGHRRSTPRTRTPSGEPQWVTHAPTPSA